MIIKVLSIGSADFLVRDILPMQLTVYIIMSYIVLTRHIRNPGLIKTSVSGTSLNWLRYFLLILAFVLFFWINDALIGQPLVLKVMPIAYTGAVFFLANCSIRQHYPALAFDMKDLKAISANEQPQKSQRLSKEELSELSVELYRLMSDESLFLNNELNLAVLADRLGVSVHDASYLINEATGNNFYNFINSLRVEQAKRLLSSGTAERLNMVGIAFASGFNSKTAFNTAFKKFTGLSPTEYIKTMYKP